MSQCSDRRRWRRPLHRPWTWTSHIVMLCMAVVASSINSARDVEVPEDEAHVVLTPRSRGAEEQVSARKVMGEEVAPDRLEAVAHE